MELRQLRSFAALAEERHFGRAAARLHVAQPALSQQIKQLERELGVMLVYRTTRRFELTDAGRRFADHARTVLGSVERASTDMALVAAGHAGRVSAGFIGTATYDLLPLAAREVRNTLPHVQLDLHGELLSPALLNGLVDGTYDVVVLRPDGVRRPEVDLRILRTERLVAVLPDGHPLAGSDRIDLARLAAEPFVMHVSGSSIHQHVLAACAAAGFRPAPVMEVSETATLVVFVAAGLGVALVPEPVRSLALDGVSYVALAGAPTVELALATRSGEGSRTAGQVAEIVARSCAGRADGATRLRP